MLATQPSPAQTTASVANRPRLRGLPDREDAWSFDALASRGDPLPASQPRSGSRRPLRIRLLTAKLAALKAKAAPNPTLTASSTATGATRTWAVTAAVQMPLFAATSSSSVTSEGSTDWEAGPKNTCPATRPNATGYATVGVSCQTAKAAASSTRAALAVTITRTRGSRSTSDPAKVRGAGRRRSPPARRRSLRPPSR